jgi:predicted nucleic acid-binding protein
MQLAAEYPKPLLIMDDRLARREALQRRLPFVGTVKILWVAQQRGVITDAVSVLDAMAANGYYLSRQLLEQASQTATDIDDYN